MADTARQYGATEDEIRAMFNGPAGTVQRVELNALSSDQLLNLIETRLREHGVSKVLPPTEMLENAYRLFARHHTIAKIVDREIKKLPEEEIEVPGDLHMEVSSRLENSPVPWDTIVQDIVLDALDAGDEVSP
jgi:hypothetical protein